MINFIFFDEPGIQFSNLIITRKTAKVNSMYNVKALKTDTLVCFSQLDFSDFLLIRESQILGLISNL